MIILLGLATVVYLAVGCLLMNKAAECYWDDRKAAIWFIVGLTWWIMVPAVCAQFGVFIIT
jgi:hypothetical protein